MKQYEIIDISGDVGLRAFGKSIEELFINSAIGMYSLITDLNLIKEEKAIDIQVKSLSLEGLLVSYLNELIFYFDAYGFIGRRVEIVSLEYGDFSKLNRAVRSFETLNCALKVQVSGEDFAPERHEGRLLIKAATYHKLRIEKIDNTWEAEVIFDI